MSNKSENKACTIDDIFINDIKEPFFYNLNIKCAKNNVENLFKNVKDIFIKGLIIHYGNNQTNSVNIDQITIDQFEKIRDYMLSIGIETKYKCYTESDKDYIYKKLIYDIEHLPDLEIHVLTNWKSNYIEKIQLNIVNNNKDTLLEINKKLNEHTEANLFLKMIKPNKLKDFAIFIQKKGEKSIQIVSFDYAKVVDYPKRHLLFGNALIR